MMHGNQYLMSADNRFVFIFQDDGNIVEYGPPDYTVLWSTGVMAPSGTTPTELILGDDGNLVAYDSSGKAYWSSKTSGSDANQLLVQNDGNTVLYNTSKSTAPWSTGQSGHAVGPMYAGGDQLTTEGYITPNTYLRSSDSRYILVFQGDGNIVLSGPGTHIMWSAGVTVPSGTTPTELILGDDGNLVAYDSNGKAYWSSKTSGSDANQLLVQNDGNTVLYNTSKSTAPWSTGTAGRT